MISISSSPSPLSGHHERSMFFSGQIHYSYYTGFYPHLQALPNQTIPHNFIVDLLIVVVVGAGDMWRNSPGGI
jgi:hypothetical protein